MAGTQDRSDFDFTNQSSLQGTVIQPMGTIKKQPVFADEDPVIAKARAQGYGSKQQPQIEQTKYSNFHQAAMGSNNMQVPDGTASSMNSAVLINAGRRQMGGTYGTGS